MKKTALSLCCALAALVSAVEVPLSSFRSLHAGDAAYRNGRFAGTPDNGGASLSAGVSKLRVAPDVNCVVVELSGREAPQLAVSLRGETQLLVRAVPGGKAGEFLFPFPVLPAKFKQVRLYYNRGNADGGKPVQFELKSFRITKRDVPNAGKKNEKMIASLPMPRRIRVVPEVRLFPRIQSKYDLVKNYLDGYSLDSGIFYDRPLFYDRTLAEEPPVPYNKLNTPKSFRRQLESAREFADGFAIFIGARSDRFLKPLEYVRGTNWRNAILVECPPPRLKNYELNFTQIDAALAMKETFRAGGALVIGSYHGQVYTPEEWKTLLAPYRERYGNRVKFMCEMRVLCYVLNKSYNTHGGKVPESLIEKSRETIRQYLRVVDGINFSGSNHLTVAKPGFPEFVFNAAAYENIIVPLVAGVLAEPEFNGKKLLGLSAHKVYCMANRTESNIDEEGTYGLRRSLRIALAANPDYIVMPEWNEINENTHVEPTVSDARTNQRVVCAVMGKTCDVGDRSLPDLILSFRQDNELALPIPIELLGLPDADGKPYKATLRLFAPDGKTLLKEFPAETFSHARIEARRYMENAKHYAKYRFLIPELRIEPDGKTPFTVRRGLPIIRLTTPPNRYHRYVKIPLRDMIDGKRVSTAFSSDGGVVRVSGAAETDSPMVTVELLADDVPVAAVDPKNEFAPPPGMVLLRWRRNTPQTGSFAEDLVKVTAVSGKVLVRTPAQYGLTGMACPTQDGDVLAGVIGGGNSVREFLFFATPDAVLDIREREYGSRVRVADVLKNGTYRKCDPDGVSWTLLKPEIPPELPMPLDAKRVDFALAGASRRPDAVYTLRIVTRAGQVFRSEPFMPNVVPAADVAPLPIWDGLAGKREVVDVPKEFLRETRFVFSPEYGDLLPTADGNIERFGVMGGYDLRAMFTPGWEFMLPPRWEKSADGYVLKFDRGSGLLLPPPIFSGAAFEVEMETSFDDVARQTIFDTAGHTVTVRVVDGKLRGELVTRNGKFAWESPLELKAGVMYRMVFTYDLSRFTVSVDGRIAAEIPASGLIQKSWVAAVGGAPVVKKAAIPCVIASKNPADRRNEGFDFAGVLKSLTVRNYPKENRSR